MHNQKTQRQNKWGGLIAGCLTLCLVVSLPTLSIADQSQDRLTAIKAEIKAARNAMESLHKTKNAAEHEAADIDAQLVASAAQIQAMEEQNTTINNLLSEIDGTIAAREQALNEQDADMQATLAALSRVARRPDTVNLNSTAPLVNKVRAASLMRHAVPQIERQAQTLADELTMLAAQKRTQVEAQQDLTAAKRLIGDKRTKLAALLAKKKSTSTQISAELKATRNRVAALETQAKDLEDLLKRIEADRKREEMDRAKNRQTAPRPHLLTRNVKTANRPTLRTIQIAQAPAQRPAPSQTNKGPRPELSFDGNFTSRKGKLRLPVRGRVIREFGGRTHKGAAAEQGVTFAVPAGSQAIASAAGKVVYAGPFRSLGGLVILNVGENYHLLIAGLSQIDVQVGQALLAGEPIGIVMPQSRQIDGRNSTGLNDKSTLYVEVRRNGKPVNPAYWFTRQDRQFAGL